MSACADQRPGEPIQLSESSHFLDHHSRTPHLATAKTPVTADPKDREELFLSVLEILLCGPDDDSDDSDDSEENEEEGEEDG